MEAAFALEIAEQELQWSADENREDDEISEMYLEAADVISGIAEPESEVTPKISKALEHRALLIDYLRSEGKTMKDIGLILGISRRRLYQILDN